jgi:hypothetical protein
MMEVNMRSRCSPLIRLSPLGGPWKTMIADCRPRLPSRELLHLAASRPQSMPSTSDTSPRSLFASVKSYQHGRQKWQGAALEVVYFDENPTKQTTPKGYENQ